MITLTLLITMLVLLIIGLFKIGRRLYKWTMKIFLNVLN